MSDHPVESVLPDARVTVSGVEGKRVVVLGPDGMLGAFKMWADILEIPRCPILAVNTALYGPPGVMGSTKLFRERVVEGIVGDRRLLRAVHWPFYSAANGVAIAEESIGVVMLDEPGRPAPTPEQWAAMAVDLRLLERSVAQ